MSAETESDALFAPREEQTTSGSELQAAKEPTNGNGQGASSSTEVISKSEKDLSQETEGKRGLKRKYDADDDDENAPRNWGDQVREPRPEIDKDDKIIGKKAKSYDIPEIRRILQHFGRSAGLPLHPKKDDLLQALVDLAAEKNISAKDRLWILRQPLGPGGVRFQTLEISGKPAKDSFPEGYAPRTRGKRDKAATNTKTSTPSSKAASLPHYTGSKAMPASGAGYSAYSTMSPTMTSLRTSKADGKKPADPDRMPGFSALQMSMTLNAVRTMMEPLIEEIAEVKKMASATQSTNSLTSADAPENQLNNERQEHSPSRSQSDGPEHHEQEYPSSPPLASEKNLSNMFEISDSEETDFELYDDE